jgi:predicted kinase
MEAVIFIGVQGSGKSSFYKERFFQTHVRINLDMLKTRHREGLLLGACIEGKQPFVVDNTNVTVAGRARYIDVARRAGFRVVGYYFRTDLKSALERNRAREGAAKVPDKGVFGTLKRLQIPSLAEGFDVLYYVTSDEQFNFRVEEWVDNV